MRGAATSTTRHEAGGTDIYQSLPADVVFLDEADVLSSDPLNIHSKEVKIKAMDVHESNPWYAQASQGLNAFVTITDFSVRKRLLHKSVYEIYEACINTPHMQQLPHPQSQQDQDNSGNHHSGSGEGTHPFGREYATMSSPPPPSSRSSRTRSTPTPAGAGEVDKEGSQQPAFAGQSPTSNLSVYETQLIPVSPAPSKLNYLTDRNAYSSPSPTPSTPQMRLQKNQAAGGIGLVSGGHSSAPHTPYMRNPLAPATPASLRAHTPRADRAEAGANSKSSSESGSRAAGDLVGPGSRGIPSYNSYNSNNSNGSNGNSSDGDKLFPERMRAKKDGTHLLSFANSTTTKSSSAPRGRTELPSVRKRAQQEVVVMQRLGAVKKIAFVPSPSPPYSSADMGGQSGGPQYSQLRVCLVLEGCALVYDAQTNTGRVLLASEVEPPSSSSTSRPSSSTGSRTQSESESESRYTSNGRSTSGASAGEERAEARLGRGLGATNRGLFVSTVECLTTDVAAIGCSDGSVRLFDLRWHVWSLIGYKEGRGAIMHPLVSGSHGEVMAHCYGKTYDTGGSVGHVREETYCIHRLSSAAVAVGGEVSFLSSSADGNMRVWKGSLKALMDGAAGAVGVGVTTKLGASGELDTSEEGTGGVLPPLLSAGNANHVEAVFRKDKGFQGDAG